MNEAPTPVVSVPPNIVRYLRDQDHLSLDNVCLPLLFIFTNVIPLSTPDFGTSWISLSEEELS